MDKLPKENSDLKLVNNAVPADSSNKVQIKSDRKKFLPVILIIFSLAIVSSATATYTIQSLIGQAAPRKCSEIKKVAINPENINAVSDGANIELSSLAYDELNRPIFKGVNYDWGMSSSNTVGTLKQRNDLATFTPLNPGTGDLFVNAKNACTKELVARSIPVVIQPNTLGSLQ